MRYCFFSTLVVSVALIVVSGCGQKQDDYATQNARVISDNLGGTADLKGYYFPPIPLGADSLGNVYDKQGGLWMDQNRIKNIHREQFGYFGSSSAAR